MAMSENEAIKEFEERLAIADYRDNIPKYYEAMELAVKDMKEVQKYRAIGTIKELQALKEKAEPKKPISIDVWGEYWKCPTCGKYVVDNWGCKYKYCRECGTKFDWS